MYLWVQEDAVIIYSLIIPTKIHTFSSYKQESLYQLNAKICFHSATRALKRYSSIKIVCTLVIPCSDRSWWGCLIGLCHLWPSLSPWRCPHPLDQEEASQARSTTAWTERYKITQDLLVLLVVSRVTMKAICLMFLTRGHELFSHLFILSALRNHLVHMLQLGSNQKLCLHFTKIFASQ